MRTLLALVLWIAFAGFASAQPRVELRPRVGIDYFTDAGTAVFSVDGRRVAVVGAGRIAIFDATTAALVSTFDIDRVLLQALDADGSTYASDIAVAARGLALLEDLVVLRGGFSEAAVVFELATGKPTWLIPGSFVQTGQDPETRRLDRSAGVLSAHGALVASASRTGRLILADVRARTVVYSADLELGALDGVAFDDSGRQLAVRSRKGALVVVDTQDWGRRTLKVAGAEKVEAFAWDAGQLVFLTEKGELQSVDVTTGARQWWASAAEREIAGNDPKIVVDRGSTYVLTTSALYRRHAGESALRLVRRERNEVTAAAGSRLALVSGMGLRVLEASRAEPIATYHALEAPDADQFGFDIGTGDFVLVETDSQAGLPDALLSLGLPFDDGLTDWFDEYGKAVVPTARVTRYRFASAPARIVEQLREDDGAFGQLELRPLSTSEHTTRARDVPVGARVQSERIVLVDLVKGRATGFIPIPGQFPEAMALTPDGAYLALAVVEGVLWFDARTRGRLGFVRLPLALDVRFEPDALAFVSGDGVGRIVDGQEQMQWRQSIREGILVGANRVLVQLESAWFTCARDGTACRAIALGPDQQVRAAVANADGSLLALALGSGRYALLREETGELTYLLETADEWIAYDDEGYFAATRRADLLVEVVADGEASNLAEIALTQNDPSRILRRLGVHREDLLSFYDAKVQVRRMQVEQRARQPPTPPKLEPRAAVRRPRRLFYVGLAVGQVHDERLQSLAYADDDADDLRDLFSTLEPSPYEEVRTLVLHDEQLTVASLDGVEAFLAEATPGDDFVLFAAGHGVYDAATIPNYYFVLSHTDIANLSETGLPFSRLEGVLARAAPTKKLFLLDTCNSGVVDVLPAAAKQGKATTLVLSDDSVDYLFARDRFVFNDLHGGADAIVMSSSRGTERSYERWDWQNGAFTESVILGLTTSLADGDLDGMVSTDELARFVARNVGRMTLDHQHPTMDRGNRREPMSFPISRAQFRDSMEQRRNLADQAASPCAHSKAGGQLILIPLLVGLRRRRRSPVAAEGKSG